ncbi:ABC transporter permease [Catenovulum maritimum]|uniref:ABC3 transporter permease C-terminal domain-containing protein n=1 Tax=Catenovulum maritimum TaxID=1513271 RepID=A0A0J8GUW2_9ALTE|nr:FtsX-like permease family protein [Catenovulum maritimum]KMT66565.1 hypothetical protein XM47_03265 [Catenovulum maritimum]
MLAINQVVASSSFAFKLLFREFKRGELSIILFAMVLAVSAVFSLALFSEKLQAGLQQQSSNFLAADSVLTSSRNISEDWISQAKATELNTATQVRFSSMLFFQDEMQLASIRAIDQAYPLRGELLVTQVPWGKSEVAETRIQPGEIWLNSKLVTNLKLEKGDLVEIGDIQLKYTEILSSVPDANLNPFNSNSLALIHKADLAATNLVQPGGRFQFLLGLAGDKLKLSEYEDWLLPKLNRDVHKWTSLESGDNRILRNVRRAEKYFLLASLLGIILASVAIAVAASRYCQRHFDLVAILKTLGASKAQIQSVFIIQLAWLALVGIGIGLLIGYLGQQLVLGLLADYLPGELPNVGYRPWWLAISTGLLSLLLFSVYPLIKLFDIPPLRVLRRQLTGGDNKDWLNWIFSGSAIFVLMWLYSGNLKLSLALFVSAGAVTLVLLILSRSIIWSGRVAGAQAGSALKLAIAGLYRRAQANSVQLISFTIALQLLMIVLVLKNDLLTQWQDQIPEGTPNYFAVNIPNHQVDNFSQAFAQQGISLTDTYPVTRGRLIAVNDIPVRDQVSKEKKKKDSEVEQSAPRSFGRELNLTAYPSVPIDNEVVAGSWWQAEETKPQVSIESGVAERMELKLGDKLSFNIAGWEFSAEVTSIRSVKWENMKPNFFMIFNPPVFESLSPSYIASFYVDQNQKAELSQLMNQFQTTSLIDIDAIINQIREITSQASLAVEFILVLVVIAGGLVLIAQIQSSFHERKQELVILRTLGASSKVLRLSVAYEFICLGLIAGLFAALSNEIALYIIQTQVFNMQASFHWQYWLLGPVVGATVVGSLGLLTCWRLLTINTQALLRSLA